MKISNELITDIEKALNIELYDNQKEFLLNDRITLMKGDTGTGKTFAHMIKVALSEGEPLDLTKVHEFCDFKASPIYIKFYRSAFIRIWEKLLDYGLEVRCIKGETH
ncbi:hypothetical protein [Bacillus infantis]|uniref:hypothetical protein n=1 Tax=Bacillus infantis TaxID=324767 RepID=UPI00321938AD